MNDGTTHFPNSRTGGTSFVSLFTLVIWAGCLVIGGLGFALPYIRPKAPAPSAPPTHAELIKVELSNDPIPPDVSPPKPKSLQPPPTAEPLITPELPPMIAVADPSTVAFALPVEGNTKIVNAKQATYTKSVATNLQTVAAPPVQTLTFGQGEGKQPAPDYPRRALNEGQEGTVLVRFTIGENGRVLAAEASTPAVWPLLNEAAVRTVRERWRFRPGNVRLYEVAIRFQMR